MFSSDDPFIPWQSSGIEENTDLYESSPVTINQALAIMGLQAIRV